MPWPALPRQRGSELLLPDLQVLLTSWARVKDIMWLTGTEMGSATRKIFVLPTLSKCLILDCLILFLTFSAVKIHYNF